MMNAAAVNTVLKLVHTEWSKSPTASSQLFLLAPAGRCPRGDCQIASELGFGQEPVVVVHTRALPSVPRV